MDAIEQLKEDLRQGRIDPHRLIELLVTLQRQLVVHERQLEAARQRVEELERKLGELPAGPGSSTPAKIDEPFSVRAEEKRQHEKQQGGCKRELSRKGRRGRLANFPKISRTEWTDAFEELLASMNLASRNLEQFKMKASHEYPQSDCIPSPV